MSLNIEQEYPDECGGWWDFWRFYGSHIDPIYIDEIVESWENWVGQDDPYPSPEDFY